MADCRGTPIPPATPNWQLGYDRRSKVVTLGGTTNYDRDPNCLRFALAVRDFAMFLSVLCEKENKTEYEKPPYLSCSVWRRFDALDTLFQE